MLGLNKKRKDRVLKKKLSATDTTSTDAAIQSPAVLGEMPLNADEFPNGVHNAAVGRLGNDMLTYSIQEDYSFLVQIMESVLEGMPPMLIQDSKISMFDINDSIEKVMLGEENLPRDYVPDRAVQSTKVGGMEVNIL